MSSERPDENMKKDDKEAHNKTLIPGTQMVQKMGHKAYKTAKKTHKSAKSAAKHGHENVKQALQSGHKKLASLPGPLGSSTSTASLSAGEEDSEHNQEEVNVPSDRSAGISFPSDEKNASFVKVESERSAAEMPETGPDKQPSSNTKDTFELKNYVSIEELQPDRLIRNPSLIAVFLAILLAAYKGFTTHSEIWDNSIPVHVALTWTVLTLVVGVEIGRLQTAKEFRQYLALQSRVEAKIMARNSIAKPVLSEAETTVISNRSHPFEEDDQPPGSFPRIRKMIDRVRFPSPSSWTTLGSDPNRKRQRWERSGNVLVSMSMTRALKGKTPPQSRKSLAHLGVSAQELEAAKAEDESVFVGSGMTISDPERMRARTLEEEAIDPLCKLRGMDIFLTESAETDLANHSFLIEHGLRDRPTFIINVLTQWGNVVIYFELPAWIKDWDTFVTRVDDSEDVIALKRFLNGDDEYRRKRFKCLPVLVDGPGPIRYIAPEPATCTVISESLPSTWRFHPAKKNQNGETVLQPCLELESDLMADRYMRSAAAMVKRFLVSMVGDVAVLIEKPYGQEEEEPRACLGMCRFDRIDVRTCPQMPPRMEEGETEEQRDMQRASMLVNPPAATPRQESSQYPTRQTV